jgi:hypothetical protein
MNNVDWDKLLTEEQMRVARTIVDESPDDPRLRDQLIQGVFVVLHSPEGVEKVEEGGFLKEYGGYMTPVLGRLLLEHVTGD